MQALIGGDERGFDADEVMEMQWLGICQPIRTYENENDYKCPEKRNQFSSLRFMEEI
jgi:hypothetical protein